VEGGKVDCLVVADLGGRVQAARLAVDEEVNDRAVQLGRLLGDWLFEERRSKRAAETLFDATAEWAS
ncbi:MAG: hypothetical protein V2A73_08970, partial [Pseudomonadota bacterium]